MATRALDVITILHALQTLGHELKLARWQPQNPAQREVFAWLETYHKQLVRITGLEAKASRFYEELNAFLEHKGFSLRLDPFDPTSGLGVVSVLDKLVRWLKGPGTLTNIPTHTGAKPAFELPPAGVRIYEVADYRGSYLLELLTQSDETLWLFVHQDASVEGLDLMKLALDVMGHPRQTPMNRIPAGSGERAFPTFAGAKVPMIDFDLTPDLAWLLGAGLTTKRGDRYSIRQAKQQFKLRMDETGAHVKVATALVGMLVSARFEPTVFTVDRPFYGWWTQRGIDVPMAVFFADWDCWRKPAGTLEDL